MALVSPVFDANYPGHCGACGDWFDVDTEVMVTVEAGIVHANCPDNDEFVPGEICQVCWMELSITGSCDCDD